MPDHTFCPTLIRQIPHPLRGPYRPPQYGRVMLPMTVLRRFDCVLPSSKAKVLAEHPRRWGGKLEGEALDRRLNTVAGQRFHNLELANCRAALIDAAITGQLDMKTSRAVPSTPSLSTLGKRVLP